mmetsp:Transcript_10886/g.11022  ORF Transcript_10886/g.11022 Transcript_10886/m.11022 type:complete len:120 (-) Transcript_10886:748-1107(-)
MYDNVDSVWWFLKALLDYLKYLQDNEGREDVKVHPKDFLQETMKEDATPFKVCDVILDIFQAHKEGFQLLDRNDIIVSLDPTTNFIQLRVEQPSSGVTWIESLGELTPGYIRDGCPIEL